MGKNMPSFKNDFFPAASHIITPLYGSEIIYELRLCKHANIRYQKGYPVRSAVSHEK